MTALQRRELIALTVLLAGAALLLLRHAGLPSAEFDEQVYLASADLLARGFSLGADVFTSQPPLFLTYLGRAATFAGGDATALRVISVALTMVGALGAWAIVRRRAGAVPALVTVALIVLAPGVVEAAAVVSADLPSVAFGTLALLAAQAARHRPAWALAAGVLLSCALLTKLLALPFAVAIAAGAIADRPSASAVRWFALGLAAAAASVALVYYDVLGFLWDGAVVLHLQARDAQVKLPTPSILVAVILSVLAYIGLLAVLFAGLAEVGRERLRVWARERADLIALVVAGFALCAVQRPLLNHHLVIIAWPLALLAGSSLPARIPRPRTIALAGLGILLVLPWAVHGRDTVEPEYQRSLQAAAAEVTRTTSPRAVVVSDIPAIPLLASARFGACDGGPVVREGADRRALREGDPGRRRRCGRGRRRPRVPWCSRLAGCLGSSLRQGDRIRRDRRLDRPATELTARIFVCIIVTTRSPAVHGIPQIAGRIRCMLGDRRRLALAALTIAATIGLGSALQHARRRGALPLSRSSRLPRSRPASCCTWSRSSPGPRPGGCHSARSAATGSRGSPSTAPTRERSAAVR